MCGVHMRTYRASSLGYSLCQLVAGHLGYSPVDPPEWLQEKFDEGHRIEPLTIEKLRDRGWMIQVSQEEINAVGDHQIEVELEVIPGKAKVVGHLDGIAHGYTLASREEGQTISSVLEVKRMYAKGWEQFNQKGWDTPGLIQKYKWQASCYMLATGMPHVMVAWNADTEELTYKLATEPFYTISDIANKLQKAEEFIEKGLIPDDCEDWPCAYYYLHGDSDKELPAPADTDLESIMAAWLEADKRAKIYEGEKDNLRKQMIELVGAGDDVAPVIKGECGVKVETYWQDASEYVTKKQAKWITKVSGPRNGK